MMQFPRNRRLRINSNIRNLVSETHVLPSNLIYPIFICEKEEDAIEIPTMKGIRRYTAHSAAAEIKHLQKLGIDSFMLFPYINQSSKDANGSLAVNKNNIICQTIKTIKDVNPNSVIIADVALDPYTSHGHDGVLAQDGVNIDNDATLKVLAMQAVIQAEAGADIISPSDMMDGRVATIRNALNDNAFINTSIFSYAGKYASSLYSPFRDAVGSGIKSGPINKLTYQIDYRNSKQAIKSILDDVNQEADGIIIKPALWYLDIIRQCSNELLAPVFAYHVSGEYAMLANYASSEDQLRQLVIEAVTCIKRSGATGIITYFAKFIVEKDLMSR